jgi:molecular chaperone GrpE
MFMDFENNSPENLQDFQDEQDNQLQQSADVKKNEIEMCLTELSLWKDQCKRISADFENFKKRVERDRAAWSYAAQAEILRNLLPVIDDFDRAMSEYKKLERSSDHESWIAGFDLIRKAFDKFLQTYGVTEITQLEHFDPEFHEAVAQVDSPTHESGALVDVVQKGYMFNGHVLRVARVTVAK